ncbi:MAG: hypothetical protein NVSMB56_14190 [Pyrinomonadaceae bacterium]
MATQIEVQPDTAACIAADAEARGISVDEFLRELLMKKDAPETSKRSATIEEFRAALDSLAEGSENLPVLPPEANSRAFYYEERD